MAPIRADEPSGSGRRARPAVPAGKAPRRRRGRTGHHHLKHEHPAPADRAGDHPAQHQARPVAGRLRGREHAVRARPRRPARMDIGHQRGRRRHRDRSSRTLHHPTDRDQPERGCDEREQRATGRRQQAGHQHPPPAEAIRQRPTAQQQPGERQRVPGHRPGQVLRGRAQVGLMLGRALLSTATLPASRPAAALSTTKGARDGDPGGVVAGAEAGSKAGAGMANSVLDVMVASHRSDADRSRTVRGARSEPNAARAPLSARPARRTRHRPGPAPTGPPPGMSPPRRATDTGGHGTVRTVRTAGPDHTPSETAPRERAVEADPTAPLPDLALFLRSRRARRTPESVGLTRTGTQRLSGLRRAEVAARAGISPEYYTRLEQGRQRRPSIEVLDALARALRLDEDARRHLHRLAAGPPRPLTEAVEPPLVPAATRRLLDALAEWPPTWSARSGTSSRGTPRPPG